jgi:hypothetical protein
MSISLEGGGLRMRRDASKFLIAYFHVDGKAVDACLCI